MKEEILENEVETSKMPTNLFDQPPFDTTIDEISTILFCLLKEGQIHSKDIFKPRVKSVKGTLDYIEEFENTCTKESLLKALKAISGLCLHLAAKAINDSNLLLDNTCFVFTRNLNEKPIVKLNKYGAIFTNHIAFDLSNEYLSSTRVNFQDSEVQLLNLLAEKILTSLSLHDNWHLYICKYTLEKGTRRSPYLFTGEFSQACDNYQSFYDWVEANPLFKL